MAKLHSLIRFHRHDLDEKRKILAELNSQLEQIVAHKQKALDDLAREKDLAAVDMACARSFPMYLASMKVKLEELELIIQFKRNEVQAATVVVQEAYLEVKRLEITQEKRDKEEADRLQKMENNTLDDIGLETFRRKQGDDQV